MPGSKQDINEQRQMLISPLGTRGIQDSHRERLPVGYPEDLASDSSPETGSIGIKGMPITNKSSPFGGR